MKKLIAPVLIGTALITYSFANEDISAQLEEMKKQIEELKAAQQSININALNRQISEIKAHTGGDNVKFNIDFRTAYDHLDYKLNKNAPGVKDLSNGVWTNKLILNMSAQPRDDLVFRGALGAYKLFGSNNSSAMNPYQAMDWYGTQSPSDTTIKLREAYFIYFGQMGEVDYTVSFGRRPSVDGFLVNLREDNADPASPVGHNINMEFDGASFMFNVEKLTGIAGMYFKLCLGRGNSKADTRYGAFTGYPMMLLDPNNFHQPNYIKGDLDSANMDLAGLLMQLYNDGQYTLMANLFKGWNMMGADIDGTPGNYSAKMKSVGDMTGGSLSLQVSGLSYENDFLMDTTVFASYAFNKTDPKGTHGVLVDPNSGTINQLKEMLGSPDKKTGHSFYAGVQIPGFLNQDKIGFEYNYGSKYWRSFTYGEDTLVGSKLATRGSAYETYYILPLLGKNLTAQIRYTYMDYKYTGSDMFFGQTGKPQKTSETPGAVKSASDLRLSLRYRY